MAKVLGALNDVDPFVAAIPGGDAYWEHMRGVVEDGHYATAYRTRGHGGQHFRRYLAVLGPSGDVQVDMSTAASATLKWFAWPRLHNGRMYIIVRTWANVAWAGNLTTTVYNDGTGVAVAPAWVEPISNNFRVYTWTSPAGTTPPGTLYRIETQLTFAGAAGDVVNLTSFEVRDLDLTAVELSAI